MNDREIDAAELRAYQQLERACRAYMDAEEDTTAEILAIASMKVALSALNRARASLAAIEKT